MTAHHAINSSVPNSLPSTPFHASSGHFGLEFLGPIPSRVVVRGNKVAVKVMDDWDAELAQRGDDIASEVVGISEWITQVRDAAVNAVAHVLGEITVDVIVNLGEFMRGVDGYCRTFLVENLREGCHF